MTDEIPVEYQKRRCECGYLYSWYVETDQPWGPGIFGELATESGLPALELVRDVVERPCPHNMVTEEHCPNCDKQLGRWGYGLAGGPYCPCFSNDQPPWWRRLWRAVLSRLEFHR